MVGLADACRALDIGMTKGYELVKKGEFPVPVRKVGGAWKVPTVELYRFVGSMPDGIS